MSLYLFSFIISFTSAKVSLDRFNDFFAEVCFFCYPFDHSTAEHRVKTKLIHDTNPSVSEGVSEIPSSDVKFYPSTYTWISEDATSHGNHRFVLQVEEEVTFQQGAINLILGPTASGKTSVLMALLGQ